MISMGLIGCSSNQSAQPVTAAAALTATRAAPTVFPTLPPYVIPATPQGSGPFPAIMVSEPGLPTHTVYRPNTLDAFGSQKLPIVAFGNGACVNIGNRFRYFLTEIASHGFLAIAIGPAGPPQAEFTASTGELGHGTPAAGSPAALLAAAGKLQPRTPTSGPTASYTTAKQLIDAIDWAIAENSRTGSAYFGRIDTTKIAVMGQSCGGLQAIDAAHDPRVTTLGVWNSGAFTDDNRALEIAAANATKATLKTLRVPTIYVTGEPSEVAFNNAEDDFNRIEGVPLFRAWREKTGHSGTYREPGGGAFGAVAVAWLKWRLKADATAAAMFAGADCDLCQHRDWHVKKKNID